MTQQKGLGTIAKVLFLTIVTFGVYGAYWAMKNLYPDIDPNADEMDKDIEATRKAASSIFFMDRLR